ncbi:MAG: vitamin K epoxide reductase family protein, partial [bacterium]|nr:vitamin K epoxide reductase family protein [bacterium]
LGGFSLALYIHFKKKQPAPLVCPIGHSCDPVVHSDYSRFMNIPVEILGVLYYLVVLVCYSLLFMYPWWKTGWMEVGLLSLSGVAFLFSVYLTAVQAFILKEWCSWCLFSAMLCAIIFFTTFAIADPELLPVLLYGVLSELGIN